MDAVMLSSKLVFVVVLFCHQSMVESQFYNYGVPYNSMNNQVGYNYFGRGNQQCECGKPSAFKSRIVGGIIAQANSMPWIVAITKYGATHCGGALISDRHILTAGHCIRWDNHKNFVVYLGLQSMNRKQEAISRKVIKASLHPGFTSTEVRDTNDIAMLTLDQPVVFTKKVNPICLPRRGEDFSGVLATIAGWGRMGDNKDASKDLLEAKVRILSDSDCMNTGLRKHLTDSMMCAKAKGIDGCQGDSGGPMIMFDPQSGRFQIIGVVSWGFGCADPRYPGVYTKVANFVDWVEQERSSGKICI